MKRMDRTRNGTLPQTLAGAVAAAGIVLWRFRRACFDRDVLRLGHATIEHHCPVSRKWMPASMLFTVKPDPAVAARREP